MNACVCGSTKVVAEAILVQRTQISTGGARQQEWIGDELRGVTCAACGREVRLDPAMTISLMHYLVERRNRGPVTSDE
jgi:hypothetical protein